MILAVDWATVAKAARTVERSLRAGMRAVLLPTRPDDPPQTIAFPDDRRLTVPGVAP